MLLWHIIWRKNNILSHWVGYLYNSFFEQVWKSEALLQSPVLLKPLMHCKHVMLLLKFSLGKKSKSALEVVYFNIFRTLHFATYYNKQIKLHLKTNLKMSRDFSTKSFLHQMKNLKKPESPTQTRICIHQWVLLICSANCILKMGVQFKLTYHTSQEIISTPPHPIPTFC